MIGKNSELKEYSSKMCESTKQGMKQILRGEDNIDKTKIVKTKQTINSELNLYIPEKWQY